MEKLIAGEVNPIKSTDKEQYNTQPKPKFHIWLLVDRNDHLSFKLLHTLVNAEDLYLNINIILQHSPQMNSVQPWALTLLCICWSSRQSGIWTSGHGPSVGCGVGDETSSTQCTALTLLKVTTSLLHRMWKSKTHEVNSTTQLNFKNVVQNA